MKSKRLLSILICAVMALTLLPAGAQAASEPGNFIFDVSDGNITISGAGSGNLTVTYAGGTTDPFPDTQNITVIGTTTAHTVVVEDGVTANITLNGVMIDAKTAGGCSFYISGHSAVNLTLIGNNSLTSGSNNAGLRVVAGAELTIGGTGALTANGGNYGAGIGGGDKNSGGSVTVNGGIVTANGGRFGAGIGGGAADIDVGGGGGSVTVNGGIVTANGGDCGAGIGGGGSVLYTGGSGGSVAISGGTVTAKGGSAGIGSGGAGIGGGAATILFSGGDGATVEITGGSVNAIGGGGQDIGYGEGGANSGTLTNGADLFILPR